MVFLGLDEDIFQFAICRLELSGFLLKLLKSGQAVIKQFIQPFTLILVLSPFVLELFEVDAQIFIFLLLKFIILLKFAVGVDEGGDFHFPVFAHSLESGVFPEGILNLDVDLMDLYLQVVNF